MELHLPTLALLAVFVTVILGVLLLLAWRNDRATNALLWWGGSYLLGGTSFALLAARDNIPDVLSIEIANTLLLLSYGALLAGARAFNGKETPVAALLLAPLIWLIGMKVPAIANDMTSRVIIVSSMQAVLVGLMAYELWSARAEPLLSRWPAIILLMTHFTMLHIRMIMVTATPLVSHGDFFRSPKFAFLAFSTVLYTMAFAFLLLSMTKERSELRHKIASLIDPLTGLANRRSFMSDADALIAARATRNAPLAVLLADLDHFKKINDVFGHAIGDRVLKIFAGVLVRTVGPEDLVGRIGGEEFAILLPGRDEAAALELAERIRLAFTEAGAGVDGNDVAATVCIGAAASRTGDLAGLLARADRALYQAKEAGRNRVAASRHLQEVAAPVPFRLRAAS